MQQIRRALQRLHAEPIVDHHNVAESYQLKHALLKDLILNVAVISDLDAITPHLRQNPVDLLVYDERQGGLEARQALAKIRDDVAAFANHWGPDFQFPMSRVVAILEEPDNPAQAFELGRVNVRGVCVAPRNIAEVLRFLADVLSKGIIREERIGMALSGGGLEGFLYQTGVLHALHHALDGRSVRSVHAYSGISSGSIAACLMAGNVPTGEIIRAMHGRSKILNPLTGSMLFDLATKDIGRRVLSESFGWAGLSPNKWIEKFSKSIPTGFFKGEGLKTYFRESLEAYGHDDTFASIAPELYIGATDQDSFEHVTFGQPPWDTVPVSEALRASCALPPFFTPTQLEGRWFIDGQVTKTCNLELLVARHCRLIFIIDPMKPLGTEVPGSVDGRGGVYAGLQAIKALVHTRFQQTLTHITERYPDVDFMVFQPDEEVAQLMAGLPMRYRIRHQIISAAYRHTLRQLRERHHVYGAKLNRFGFKLRQPEELMKLEQDDGDFRNSAN